jgi:hypothetical protein
LSGYSYGRQPEPEVKNVGWLCVSHQFETGPVPEGFIDRLSGSGKPVNCYRGFHECELCLAAAAETGTKLSWAEVPGHPESDYSGNGELRVTGVDGTVYAAPMLILHYVSEHEYRPPDAFIDVLWVQGTGENVHHGDRGLQSSPCGTQSAASWTYSHRRLLTSGGRTDTHNATRQDALGCDCIVRRD